MLRLLFGFWGIEVAAWQVATSVWVLGDQGHNLASCDFCLGSGGSRLQAGKLRPWFGFWGIRLSCGLASRNFFLASRQRYAPDGVRDSGYSSSDHKIPDPCDNNKTIAEGRFIEVGFGPFRPLHPVLAGYPLPIFLVKLRGWNTWAGCVCAFLAFGSEFKLLAAPLGPSLAANAAFETNQNRSALMKDRMKKFRPPKTILLLGLNTVKTPKSMKHWKQEWCHLYLKKFPGENEYQSEVRPAVEAAQLLHASQDGKWPRAPTSTCLRVTLYNAAPRRHNAGGGVRGCGGVRALRTFRLPPFGVPGAGRCNFPPAVASGSRSASHARRICDAPARLRAVGVRTARRRRDAGPQVVRESTEVGDRRGELAAALCAPEPPVCAMSSAPGMQYGAEHGMAAEFATSARLAIPSDGEVTCTAEPEPRHLWRASPASEPAMRARGQAERKTFLCLLSPLGLVFTVPPVPLGRSDIYRILQQSGPVERQTLDLVAMGTVDLWASFPAVVIPVYIRLRKMTWPRKITEGIGVAIVLLLRGISLII
ncbi:hypothetical protein B0H14DRAFT_2582434 [Mycena olivaceomarginata]|nr:hypothetical protein B0H14DRAFT_2582434 [Mycena olivaceomarginata]